MTSFNLVHEPWIPVTAGGAAVQVSLLEALTRAHELDGLGLEEPLQTVAVFRQVLLPVALDALGVPRSEAEWADRWEAGRLDGEQLRDYLAEHADRFELFAPVTPFAQVADLRTAKDETKPVSLLLAAVAAGNNVPLFSSSTDADPPRLSPAAAARALLAAHCWDTAAIKSGAVGDPAVKNGKTLGNPTGPVGALGVTLPLGPTLAHTLLLNTPIIRQGLQRRDRPQWRAEPATAAWSSRPALGLMDLLTFQSRRIRLVPEVAADGTVTVSQVVLAAGDRLVEQPEYELHTMWRQEPKSKAGTGAPPRRPVRHQAGKEAWRGLAALLAARTPTKEGVSTTGLLNQLACLRTEDYVPDTLALQVLTVGVLYGNQSAVVEDVLVDLIPLPVVALTTDAPVRTFLHRVVAQAEDVRRAGNDLGDRVRRAAGGEKLPWDKSLRVGDALMHQLTAPVRRMLAGLQRRPDLLEEAEAAWHQVARRMALDAGEAAIEAAAPQAFLGRPTADGKAVIRLSTAEARYREAVFATFPDTRRPALPGGQS